MRFTLGEDVIVTWIDSGMGQPASVAGKHEARLVLGETHGKVTFFGKDPELHKVACRRGRCRCAYLELAMCSTPGRDDEKADLAGIWAESIVEVRRWDAWTPRVVDRNNLGRAIGAKLRARLKKMERRPQ